MSKHVWVRRTRSASVGLAVAALLTAGIVGYLPWLLPPGVRETAASLTAGIDVSIGLLVFGCVLGLYGIVASWVWRASDRSSWLGEAGPGDPERSATLGGEPLEQAFDLRSSGDVDIGPDATGPLQDALREVLIDTLAPGDPERAREQVEQGTWTGDRYAAAFLAENEAVEFPLRHRVFAWLYPGRAYEQRVRRTLRAVENVCEGRLLNYEPPEPSRRRLDRLRDRVWGGRR